jgi:hypothetical protein
MPIGFSLSRVRKYKGRVLVGQLRPKVVKAAPMILARSSGRPRASELLLADDRADDVRALEELGLLDDERRGQTDYVAVGRLRQESLLLQLLAHLHRVDLLVDDDGVEQTLAPHRCHHLLRQLAQLRPQDLA